MEIGNSKSPTSNNSGSYYVIDPNNTDAWGYTQGMLNTSLKKLGLEEYIHNRIARDSNIKVNIAKEHDTNKYSSYLAFDSNGNMVLSPILYKNDNIQLVNGNYVESFWWDEEVDITFEPSNLANPITFPDKSSKKLIELIEDRSDIKF